jgi:hypothetical protein
MRLHSAKHQPTGGPVQKILLQSRQLTTGFQKKQELINPSWFLGGTA